MKILPYKLATTKDLLTSRAGLLALANLMEKIGFNDWVDEHLEQPGSNRGFKPSSFVAAIVLILNEGGRCLDDIKHIREDEALRLLLRLTKLPGADTLGNWLRRTGEEGVK